MKRSAAALAVDAISTEFDRDAVDHHGSAGRGLTGVASRVRVAIAIQDLAFHQEVLDFLGRQPRIEVVSSSTNPMEPNLCSSGAANADTRSADVMVVCPAMGGSLARSDRSDGTVVFVVAEEMTVPALRTAIEVGAQGAFCWPDERADLAHAIPLAGRPADATSRTRGRVVAVLGARGGAGVTFLASHLTAAFARSGRRSVLVDMDPDFGDVTAALGLVEEDGVNSIEDLVSVIDELGPDHVSRALTSHDEGFDVLLSRPPVARADSGSAGARRRAEAIPIGLYGASVALLAVDYQAVVLHLPRALGPLTGTAVRLADDVVVVAGLDLMSLYGARRILGSLKGQLEGTAMRIVVNATRRPEVSIAEVERVLGVRPVARIRSDPAVPSAQAAGRLLGVRSRRAWRDVAALGSLLVRGADEEDR